MKLKSLFIILNALSLVTITIVILIIIEYKVAYTSMEQAYINKNRSFLLADELRQSSDDLTRLVRTYVITTNIRFKEQYYEILAIRNGLYPRPEHYNRIYWDFLAVNGTSSADRIHTKAISLKDLMIQAGFTQEELAYLRKSHNQSDALVNLEEKAMQAVDGLYQDDKGFYTVIGKPDLKFARELLHSDEYHLSKVKIMQPIDKFLQLLEERTDKDIFEAQKYVKSVKDILEFTVFFFILLMITSIGIMFHRILYPLMSLKKSMLQLASNDTYTTIPSIQYKDEIGDMISAVNIFKDKTEKLIVSEQKVKLLFDSVGEGFFGLDAKGAFTFVNPVGCETFGYTADELIGVHLYKTINTQSFPTKMNKLLLNDESTKTTGVIELQHSNGKSFPAEYTSTPIFDKDNQIEGSVVVFTDITQRKKHEDALKLAKENAEMANKSKTLFLASMSHELRTPLNAILGFAQLILKDTSLKTKQKENLETIYKSGKHLLNIISEILEVAKLQAGKIEITNHAFDLHSFFDNIKLIFENRAKAKGIDFSCDDYMLLPHYIINDEQRLRQILFNLLSNAIKFTHKGNIHLGLKYEGQDLYCLVSDTGPGISETDMSIIFKPFEQIKSVQGHQKGTGLGLAITQELVILMGGKIHVESTLGKGTKFYFNVMSPQAIIEDVPKKHEYKDLVLSSDSPTYKVLVVDDINENRSLLVQMMQYLGFETCEAEGGVTAIEQLPICKPDIIFMDIQMPRMNGFEAIKKIRSNPIFSNLPIVLVSANVFEEDKQKAMDKGADAFIEKPIKEEELILTLQTLLNLKFVQENDLTTKTIQSRPEATRLSLQQIQSVYQAAQELDTSALEIFFKDYFDKDTRVISYMKECLHEYQFNDILLLCETFINTKND